MGGYRPPGRAAPARARPLRQTRVPGPTDRAEPVQTRQAPARPPLPHRRAHACTPPVRSPRANTRRAGRVVCRARGLRLHAPARTPAPAIASGSTAFLAPAQTLAPLLRPRPAVARCRKPPRVAVSARPVPAAEQPGPGPTASPGRFSRRSAMRSAGRPAKVDGGDHLSMVPASGSSYRPLRAGAHQQACGIFRMVRSAADGQARP